MGFVFIFGEVFWWLLYFCAGEKGRKGGRGRGGDAGGEAASAIRQVGRRDVGEKGRASRGGGRLRPSVTPSPPQRQRHLRPGRDAAPAGPLPNPHPDPLHRVVGRGPRARPRRGAGARPRADQRTTPSASSPARLSAGPPPAASPRASPKTRARGAGTRARPGIGPGYLKPARPDAMVEGPRSGPASVRPG